MSGQSATVEPGGIAPASYLRIAAKSLGWHPFRGPAAIRSRAYKGLPSCEYHGFCTGFGCHVGAKAGSALNGIPEAEKTGKLKVVTGAWVTRIGVDSQGARHRRVLRQGRT